MAMLTGNDVIRFGRHKGKTVAEVLNTDPSWLDWLRNERRNSGQGNSFSIEVHAALNELIQKKRIKSKFPKWDLAKLQENINFLAGAGEAVRAAEVREEASVSRDILGDYNGEWGAW